MAGGPIGANVYRVGRNYPGVWAPTAEAVTTPAPVAGPYTAPPIDDNQPFMNSPVGAYAPVLSPRGSTVDVPSAQRIGTIPRMEFYPNGVRPPEEFYGKRDADKAHRHEEEQQNAVGWGEVKDTTATGNRWARNPRLFPPPEPRPTSLMSPRSYSFTRPFDQFNRQHDSDPPTGTARQLNGVHFSMADHRRRYPILGMNPPMYRRNTYRIEPTPWDVNIVDSPPVGDSGQVRAETPGLQIVAVEVPAKSRSFRLM